MGVAERLVEIREKNGYTRKRLSDELRRPYRTITKYETGEREPGHSYIVEISQKFGVSTDYILGASDSMTPTIKKETAPPVSDEAMRLAKDYDSLDHWGQKQVRLVADNEAARVADQRRQANWGEGEEPEDNVVYAPFRCSIQPASAGTGVYLGPESFETIYVQENDLTRRASFGVPVRGDSMEPRFHDGDILVVEAAEVIEQGEIGIFSIDGEGYVKELGEGELISLNPKYKPVPMTDSIHCHGKVIGVLDPEIVNR